MPLVFKTRKLFELDTWRIIVETLYELRHFFRFTVIISGEKFTAPRELCLVDLLLCTARIRDFTWNYGDL